MRRFYFLLILGVIFFNSFVTAQKAEKGFPYTIRLVQTEIIDFPALQSFSYAVDDGKWLLLGGRKDGLHRRQPWATFDEDGRNNIIYVIDPIEKKVWKSSSKTLPVSLADQLQSTNMEFCQTGNKLLLAGGYGYSKQKDDHITFPYLTVINVKEIMHSIINDLPFNQHIIQIKDERMAVTGGRMVNSGEQWLLIGGQRFDGLYNPHGPDHGPGFKQEYTNEIRTFKLNFDNSKPEIKYYSAIKDTVNLHRRDYNLVPQIFTNGLPGFTVFSGVFQYNKDLPYTTSVDISGNNHHVIAGFHQKLNHYHSAVLPLFDTKDTTMYTLFLGGIAQYYPDVNGKIVNNTDVPFTKTISLVSRNKNGIKETWLPVQMPGYLGASAEFIFAENISMYSEGVALPPQENAEILIGYIVGGIHSGEKNIFWSNTGEESKASNNLIKVYLKRNSVSK